jgi:hypothetical protein
MFLDPLTQWEDGYPYLVLAEVDLTPASSMADVMDASFALMAKSITQEERAAWDALRFPESRLVIDFFLYRAAPDVGPSVPEGALR